MIALNCSHSFSLIKCSWWTRSAHVIILGNIYTWYEKFACMNSQNTHWILWGLSQEFLTAYKSGFLNWEVMGSSCYLESNRKCSNSCIVHFFPSPAHKCFPHLILHSSTGHIYCLKCVELWQNKDLNKPQVWKVPTGNFKLNTTKHKKTLVRGGRSSLIKSLLQPRHVGPNSPLPPADSQGAWAGARL